MVLGEIGRHIGPRLGILLSQKPEQVAGTFPKIGEISADLSGIRNINLTKIYRHWPTIGGRDA